MATPKDLPDVGGFIRDLRRNAKISLRQLAEQAGVSNPYLSQIERGLRKPSAEVLQQLASALRVSTPAMYLRAGLLDDKEGHGVLAAIAVDADLTMAQKQSLSQIYETFRRENTRLAEAQAEAERASTTEAQAAERTGTPGGTAGATTPTDVADQPADVANLAATGPTTAGGTPTEAVLESVAVTEAGTAPAPSSTSTSTPEKKAAGPAVRKAAEAAEEETS
ncbi:helix-turn-helix domain-containing protein [Micromonospora luteifusca]|uniref:Transcriptional regulator with XRE-family HTH domain n=1 Tax=Micromonospora luteifusca TaxID=709860 RepID=A0ABS2LSM2_9ACTN|nr:helix-turn-helix transcriptional regulator [Micromonospora luteifusca]MBM7491163.1 transcriptional regulator with XRE-family HTH domain [Micromonospora luteifusca]